MKKFIIVMILVTALSCQDFVPANRLAEAYLTIGNMYFEQRKYSEAINYYQLAIKLSPKLKAIEYNLALVYIENKNYALAEELLIKLDIKTNTEIMNTLAYTRYKLDKVEESLDLYDAVLTMNSIDLSALYNSSVILLTIPDEVKGLARLTKASENYPRNSKVQYLLASTLWKQGKKKESLEYWDKYSKSETPSNNGLFEYCLNLAELKMYAESNLVLDGLVKDKDAQANWFFQKAYLLLAFMGNYEEGLQMLQLAIQKGFSEKTGITKLMAEPDLVQAAQLRDFLKKNNLL